MWSFDDTNLTRLRSEAKMDSGDDRIFNYDPKRLDWHSYLVEVHIPAVLKYARKEKGGA
jgi:fatty acyl-CoA reductase